MISMHIRQIQIFLNLNKVSLYCWSLDEDECASLATNACDSNALCTNTYGSYVCRCLKGYVGDGRRCSGTETKKLFIWKVWSALAPVISLKIGTSHALTIVALNNFFTDLDECRSATINDCDPNALCTNTEGSYVCRCFKGFRGDGKTCTGRVVTLIIYCNVNDLISDSLSRCTSSLSAFVYKVLLSSSPRVCRK